MKKMKICIVLIIIFSTNNFAKISKSEWSWFSAFAIYNDWSIHKGNAQIDVIQNKFMAKLFLENGALIYTISGRIHKNEIIAKAISHGTEGGPEELIGQYKEIEFLNGKKMNERYLFVEKKLISGLTIGITRNQ